MSSLTEKSPIEIIIEEIDAFPAHVPLTMGSLKDIFLAARKKIKEQEEQFLLFMSDEFMGEGAPIEEDYNII